MPENKTAEVPAEETAQPVETDGRPAEDDGEKITAGKGIIIGIAAGIAVCAAAAVIIVWANKKKKKAG